ncbi:MAG: GNAT family N-acetyltransferase [Ferruginibacter sp.]|nr:GNAT family N-acetyltransferase [Cytophagales bacterium]
MTIRTAQSETDALKCWPALSALRPHLVEGEWVETIKRMQGGGYQLVFVEADRVVPSVAGFRFTEHLFGGPSLYIDDLSTLPEHRGQGYAGRLLDHLIALARTRGCAQVHLDSGHHRYDAHRLYLNKGFRISSHHFSLKLTV